MLLPLYEASLSNSLFGWYVGIMNHLKLAQKIYFVKKIKENCQLYNIETFVVFNKVYRLRSEAQ